MTSSFRLGPVCKITAQCMSLLGPKLRFWDLSLKERVALKPNCIKNCDKKGFAKRVWCDSLDGRE